MKPEFHYSKKTNNSLNIARSLLLSGFKKHENISINLPNYRTNTINLNWKTKKNIRFNKYFDASNGKEIVPRKTAGGNFLYRFHFELYALPKNKARLLIGFTTMVMFVAIISGIIIHSRIFKDIFTFNPNKNIRNFMDGHILTAVASLPFLIMITYSGLILFMNLLMPWSYKLIYKIPVEYKKDINNLRTSSVKIKYEINGNLTEKKLSIIINKANKIFKDKIKRISIRKNNDGLILIQIIPNEHSTIFNLKFEREYLLYNGSNTKLIKYNKPLNTNSLVMGISSTFGTLHRARFADYKMRLLFFLCGICGIVMSATTLILWVLKRKRKYLKRTNIGFLIVEKLNLGIIVGIFIAIGIYFLSNRIISADLENRNILEIKSFFLAWGLSFIFATLRQTKKAWIELLLLACLIFLLIPILDFITLTKNFDKYLMKNSILYYFDAAFLFLGFIFAFILYKLIKK